MGKVLVIAIVLVSTSAWATDVRCRLVVRDKNHDMQNEKADQAILKKEMKDGLDLYSKEFSLKVKFADYKLSHVGQSQEPHEPHTVELTLNSSGGIQAHTLGDISKNPVFLSIKIAEKAANAACSL